jgi:ectoine hydroxylase-related dioxygenase (phytanoyl-CoA dioxygenase family)
MNKNFEYAVAKSFLSEETVSLLSSEFGRAFDDPKANEIYRGVVQFTAKQLENSEVLSAVLGQIISHFTDTLGASDIVLDKVWFVKSQSKDTDPNKLPYLPHFDKHRYLKAMVYLHDVVEDHGPIHFGRLVDPAEIDSRRRRLPANYKDLGLNTIKESEMRSGMEPVLGKAGDVIFFDTNAAHCAGIVSDCFERNVIRFDFDVRGFNSGKSFFRRLVSSISSWLH